MVIRKLTTAIIALAILVGCGTYAGSGAYAGATLGSILGSAIGGITGGPRGSDLGTIVGMGVGGAVGAAIGEQADKKMQEQSERRRERIEQRRRERDRDDYGYYNEQPPYEQRAPHTKTVSMRTTEATTAYTISRVQTIQAVIALSNPPPVSTRNSSQHKQSARCPSRY